MCNNDLDNGQLEIQSISNIKFKFFCKDNVLHYWLVRWRNERLQCLLGLL